MNKEQIARMVAKFDLGDALGHLGAYLSGGDELGEVSYEDASDAYNSICVHVSRMQIAIDAAGEVFDGVDFSVASDAMIAAASICAELATEWKTGEVVKIVEES